MPFKSQAQSRAAFGGYLGPEMKAKASTWARETPNGISALPAHVKHNKPAQRKHLLTGLMKLKGLK